MKRWSRRKGDAGYTMIELTVTMAIASLVMGVALPSFTNATVKARVADLKMNVRVLQNIVTGYGTEHNGDVPTSRAQLVSSPTYKTLKNPFKPIAQGLGSWGDTNGISTEDNSDVQAPVAIWNVDPDLVALPRISGVIFYVPYRNEAEAMSGVNTLPLGGADAAGYSAYAIEAMGVSTNGSPLALPIKDTRVATVATPEPITPPSAPPTPPPAPPSAPPSGAPSPVPSGSPAPAPTASPCIIPNPLGGCLL